MTAIRENNVGSFATSSENFTDIYSELSKLRIVEQTD